MGLPVVQNAFVVTNILFPGAGLVILAIAALGPGGLLFLWGRINDNLGTPDHAHKCLKSVADEIIGTTLKLEKGIMLHAQAGLLHAQADCLHR
jgi:hypothetical protein